MGRVFLRSSLCSGEEEGWQLEQKEVVIGPGRLAPVQKCLRLLDPQSSSMHLSAAGAELTLPMCEEL